MSLASLCIITLLLLVHYLLKAFACACDYNYYFSFFGGECCGLYYFYYYYHDSFFPFWFRLLWQEWLSMFTSIYFLSWIFCWSNNLDTKSVSEFVTSYFIKLFYTTSFWILWCTLSSLQLTLLFFLFYLMLAVIFASRRVMSSIFVYSHLLKSYCLMHCIMVHVSYFYFASSIT